MPLYYFDQIEDGLLTADGDGVERPETESALREAVRAAFDIAKDGFRDGQTEFAIALREGAKTIATVKVAVEIARAEAVD